MSCLKHAFRLKNRSEFEDVYASRTRWHSKYFVLFFKESKETKVGFTASKKVGNSPERNFAKRRLKALFLDNCTTTKAGNYILVAKKEITEADFTLLRKEFRQALLKLSLLNNSEP